MWDAGHRRTKFERELLCTSEEIVGASGPENLKGESCPRRDHAPSHAGRRRTDRLAWLGRGVAAAPAPRLRSLIQLRISAFHVSYSLLIRG